MADVFLSYKREEIARAKTVARGIEDAGYSVFYDQCAAGIRVGETWDLRLELELEACKAVVSLWSPASVKSNNVRDECRRAGDRGILCPAYIERCIPPLGLGLVQAADLSRWKGKKNDSEWQSLLESIARLVRPRFVPSFLDGLRAVHPGVLDIVDVRRQAALIGCEWPALAAVVQVESRQGFDAAGRPHMLFERHLFSSKTNGRFDADHPNISRRAPGGYPVGQDARWEQLTAAYALDGEAALQSAAWGRFLTLGQNFSDLSMTSAHEYVAKLARSEMDQLEAFVAYVCAHDLIDELRRKDWAGFARGYNGPNYSEFQYDQRMAAAYRSLASMPRL